MAGKRNGGAGSGRVGTMIALALLGVVGAVSWVAGEVRLAKGATGPDVIVGVLPSVRYWGRTDEIAAFSIATTSCNQGDRVLEWDRDTNRHPVIAQNMFRYSDGRFIQMGQSWLKHGFFALARNACGLGCQNPGDNQLLGIGCSDPYDANLNGDQSGLGPRFEVDASTGHFSYPFTGEFQTGDAIFKRLQVPVALLTEDLDARFFIEGHYIAPDDAEAGNDLNNASYREVTVIENTATVPSSFQVLTEGSTQQGAPAIQAWKDLDPLVQLETVDVRDDGRYFVASKAVALGGGLWRYELAVHNLNSHRSAASFSVSVPNGVSVTDIGFHRAAYHSGEPYADGPWVSVRGADDVAWGAEMLFADGFESGLTGAWRVDLTTPTGDVSPPPDSGGSFADVSNALRWGNLYNFWFTADRPPTASTATLTLLRPGRPASVQVSVQGPS